MKDALTNDKEASREIKDSAITAEAASAPKSPPNNASEADCFEAKKRTVGNKIFDWGVYSSIAWAGVSLMSLLSAHEANHGANKLFGWLRWTNKKLSSGVYTLLSKTIMKNKPHETIKAWANGTALYYMCGLGGTTLMWPIKALEDNRLKLSAKIDNFLGTTPPNQECIEHEPKQTWKSVLAGRLFSVVGIGFTSFVLIGPKYMDKISKWFGKHATDGWMKILPKSKPEKVRKWADISAFDMFFTVITAAATYAFSRFVARRDEKPDAEEGLYKFNPEAPEALEPGFSRSKKSIPFDEEQKKNSRSSSPSEKFAPKSLGGYAQKIESEPSPQIQPAL